LHALTLILLNVFQWQPRVLLILYVLFVEIDVETFARRQHVPAWFIQWRRSQHIPVLFCIAVCCLAHLCRPSYVRTQRHGLVYHLSRGVILRVS